MATTKNTTTVKATVVDTLLGNKAFKGTLTDANKRNFMFNAKGEGHALLTLAQENGRYTLTKGTTPTNDQDFASWLEVAKVHYLNMLKTFGHNSILVGVSDVQRILGFTCGSNFNSSSAAYSTAIVNAINAAKVILRNIRANDSAQIAVDTKRSKINAMTEQRDMSNHKVIATDIANALWDMPNVPQAKHSGVSYSKTDGLINIQYRANGKTRLFNQLSFGTKRQLIDFITTRLTRDSYAIPSKGHGNVADKPNVNIPSEIKARQSARRNPANKKVDVVATAA